MATGAISGETYSSKVAAVFDGEQAARNAAHQILIEGDIRAEQVSVVQPHDEHLGRKIEPESQGIAWTLVKSHLYLGLAGAFVGVVAAIVTVTAELSPFSSAPLVTLGFGLAVGVVAGLLAAGLYSLRPDHLALIARLRTAAGEGRWAVIVHVRNAAEKARVETILGVHRVVAAHNTL